MKFYEGKGKKRKSRAWLTVIAAVLMMGAMSLTAWAGEWQKQEDGAWKYEQDGEYLTGWQYIDGVWYYMDTETAEWVSRPALTQESACYLVENAVNKTGWYDDEDLYGILHYKVDEANKSKIVVSIIMETAPDEWTTTLNTFDINRRTNVAQSQQTKLKLNLYE
ncbi:MAG: hypothetical protein LUD07_07590 [Clostridiales bacterium]|nr:hypothetical protein [Clostridiales bacterium]